MDITAKDLERILNPELDPVQNARRLKTLARARAMRDTGSLSLSPLSASGHTSTSGELSSSSLPALVATVNEERCLVLPEDVGSRLTPGEQVTVYLLGTSAQSLETPAMPQPDCGGADDQS